MLSKAYKCCIVLIRYVINVQGNGGSGMYVYMCKLRLSSPVITSTTKSHFCVFLKKNRWSLVTSATIVLESNIIVLYGDYVMKHAFDQTYDTCIQVLRFISKEKISGLRWESNPQPSKLQCIYHL